MSLLEELGLEVGDLVRVRKGDRVCEGVVMPKHAYSDPEVLVIKLESGYNVGILVDRGTVIEVLGKRGAPARPEEARRPPPKGIPKVFVLGTGGTIASKVEYETGAVRPAMGAGELLETIPEAEEIADLDVEVLFSILSENMEPGHWEAVAEKVYAALGRGYSGVVVAHGTDTMAFTASAIAFAVQDLPAPVVFVGSQRSSDRPSTDAALNFVGALVAASKAPFAESVVAMHAGTSDELVAIHRGVRVRKMHTSRRDAFRSINSPPLALVDPVRRELRQVSREARPREKGPRLYNGFERKVALIYSYPGIEAEMIDVLVERGYKGIVVAGTGFGHVPEKLIPSIKRASDSGIPVVVTSQTLFGRVNLLVYSTGREMLRAGAIPCEDMLPEVAYVKLSWALKRHRDLEEVARIMRTNLVGEISSRHTVFDFM